ncbi:MULTISPECIES: transcription termination factor Rho [Micrococcus]|uniref:Transcription termination factor Rho n=2 Tax=Micrococcus TaxID=1269 RepID=A0ABR6CYE7_9MICC|nr:MULTISPECIES: transcription termination factor Rho [Micrococcus]KIK88321.1 transcription termination factor Rho [Micrococcus luteus]KZE63049.1 transcription termination factor Rho [Micrococcus aloeverae]MBA9058874.1 transcription termination factor Rho [Micrococcus yunnanensis]MCV7468878.1 transcription termination factor Rho [Micrococcus luteus]MCV7499504.1 transcription termination factor Rho [Micrococcus luteus]
MTESTEQTTPTNGGGLASLKLAQLQALASQLGIAGGSRMRKADLVTAISDHQRGGSVADRDAAERAAQAPAAPAAETAPAAASSEDAAPAAERPARRRSRRADADTSAPAAAQDGQPQAEAREAQTEQAPRETASDQDRSGGSETRDEGEDRPQSERRSRGRRRAGDDDAQQGQDRRSDGAQGEDGADADRRGDREDRDDNGRENGRGRNGRNGRDRDNGRDRENGRENNRDRENGRDGSREQRGDKSEDGGRGDGGRGDRSRRDDRDDEGGRNRRNRRNRNERGRNRRGRGGPEVDETELTEDDVLQPVAGILDVLDNYAFVRTSGYLPGPNDVYVSLAMVKKYGLRKGDAVVGAIRAPRDGEKQQHHGGGSNRQKFNALVKISSVNGQPAVEHPQRVEFGKLVPLYPQERLRLETDPKLIGPRVIDLVSPIGKGQRGLIVSPPKAGKTMILQSIANAIKTNNPEVHLMMVLVDERPEEVTDMQRSVDGEVIASTFDRPADDHTTLAELAIERAKRLVEMGRDVVVLLDSMTRLGRAYNLAAPASGRILSGGVDSSALYPPKKFFGAARNIENGGSLTILATALVETGSRMDEVIFEEFKGTGNMELRLSRHLAERRIFPAVDVNASGTRREEALLSQEEVKIMWKLRRVLSGLEQQQALDLLTNKIKDTASNAEFLMLVSKTTLGSKGDD